MTTPDLSLGVPSDEMNASILRELKANGALLRSIRKQKGARDALNYREVMASPPARRESVPSVAQTVAELRHPMIHPIDWAAICLAAIASPRLDRFSLERIALHLGASAPVVQAAFGWLPSCRPDGRVAANPYLMNLTNLRAGYHLARPRETDERAALDLFLAERDPALQELLVERPA